MEDTKKKKIIHICIVTTIIVVLIAIIGLIILKYEVEGEKNMPFNLSKIVVVSTAEGMQNADTENKWNFNIVQNNDIYITIEKNDNYKKSEKIEKIIFENFSQIQSPIKGTFKKYMPNSTQGRTFINTEEFLLEDSLEYRGNTKTDLKNLEISNIGGTICIRYSNEEIGNYISNEEEQIKHDGTLISKTGTTLEEIKGKIAFDLIIKLENKSYKANIVLELPCGDIIQQGTTNIEKIDMQDIIFKRI